MTSKNRTAAVEVRRLMRRSDRAVLGSLLGGKAEAGWPYGSLVLTASDHDGTPLLLLSALAEHTKNLQADDRISLLFEDTRGLDDPLTGPRATILGRAVATGQMRHRQRYLYRHPSAAQYADFGDFAFYRVEVERAHLVAGFGRITWTEGAGVVPPDLRFEALAEAKADIVSHMNRDHAEALDLIAAALLGLEDSGWRMTGIDPEGTDLRLGGRVARLDFGQVVQDSAAARSALVALTKKARGSGHSNDQ